MRKAIRSMLWNNVMDTDNMNPTKQDVIARLRPLFQAAVRNRSGVSYFLSDAERSVFSVEDLRALETETDYPAPALCFVRSWREQDSTQ